jgi:hypothetical protein
MICVGVHSETLPIFIKAFKNVEQNKSPGLWENPFLKSCLFPIFRVEPDLGEEDKTCCTEAIKILEDMALFLKPNQNSQLSR